MAATITTAVDVAIAALNAGDVIGLPTETVYGLAARIDIPSAVRRVFDVKGRPYDHPLIVHDSSLQRAQRWGIFDDRARRLAQEFWPGPLTLLVPRTSVVPDEVTGGRDSVAIRVPAHSVALQIIDGVDCGIVAPSANRFGRVSPTTAQHVADDLNDDVSLIVDGGDCSYGVESTIVDCTGSTIQILRPGAISSADITRVLDSSLTDTDGPSRAPGMLESHYAPNCRVVLVETGEDAHDLLEVFQRENKDVFVLDRTSDISEYAHHMYSDLREADRCGVDVVIAVLPKATGLGVAIRDRLQKAAAR
jgi:L-threonylcarbamoyladenylate synthase